MSVFETPARSARKSSWQESAIAKTRPSRRKRNPVHESRLAERKKFLEMVVDFKYKSIQSALDIFSKLVTYFFAFLAVVLGFVFTQKLPVQYERVLVYAIILTAALYLVITIAFGWGAYAGFQQIKKSLEDYDEEAYSRLQVGAFIDRGTTVGILVATACVGVLVVICAAVLSKLYCPLQLSMVCGP